MDNLPEEWEAILPSYGQIEMWDFTSHNNTLDEGWCAIDTTLDEGWCDTLHHITKDCMKDGVKILKLKGGVRSTLHLTKGGVIHYT